MAHTLKTEVEELQSFIADLMSLHCIENAVGNDKEKISKVTDLIVKKMSNIHREADRLDIAMQARDLNIRALGEKLSVLRMKHAKPFIVHMETDVDARKRTPSSSRRKSLFRKEDNQEWTQDDAASHMKELSDQIARLSLLPMGLTGKDLEEQVADVSATRLYEAKAVNLIKVARGRGMSDDKIRTFLRKKKLPEVTINRCFNMVHDDAVENMNKEMPQPPKLKAENESDSEDFEQYEFSSLPVTPKTGS